MAGLSPAEALLLLGGGLASGVVNTLAGGGSLLTVPLLVLLGLPGGIANGTNRVGILLQCAVATWGFRSHGHFEPRRLLSVLPPVVVGAALGAAGISRVPDATFERLFGLVMLGLLVPTLRGGAAAGRARPAWGPLASTLAFGSIGVYAGAFQAGVGVPLLLVLLRSGHDAVGANAVKVAVIGVTAVVAVPIFAAQGQIAWLPAAVLALGFSAGGALGARWAVQGGERLVRPVLAVAVVVLALRMLGLF